MSSGRGTRRLTIDGHRVRILGDERPRPFRGFFAGDELPGEHHAEAGAEAVAAGDRPPPGLVVVEVDGARFELHARPSGWFHSHTLPFQRFDTVEDAAREIVRKIDQGVLRGGA